MNEIKGFLYGIIFLVQWVLIPIIVEIEYFFFPPIYLPYFPKEVIRRIPDSILHPRRWESRQQGRLIQLQYKIRAKLEYYYENYCPVFTNN